MLCWKQIFQKSLFGRVYVNLQAGGLGVLKLEWIGMVAEGQPRTNSDAAAGES